MYDLTDLVDEDHHLVAHGEAYSRPKAAPPLLPCTFSLSTSVASVKLRMLQKPNTASTSWPASQGGTRCCMPQPPQLGPRLAWHHGVQLGGCSALHVVDDDLCTRLADQRRQLSLRSIRKKTHTFFPCPSLSSPKPSASRPPSLIRVLEAFRTGCTAVRAAPVLSKIAVSRVSKSLVSFFFRQHPCLRTQQA